MRYLSCSPSLLLLLASALPALAAPIPLSGLFNTGVDALGVPLPDNAPDLHYVFVNAPEPAFIGLNPLAATAAGGFPIGPWLGDNATSAWLTPRPDTTGNLGDWVYRTTFTVPAGSDPLTAYLTGVGAADNNLRDVLVNGVSIKNPSTSGNNVLSGFGGFAGPLSITRGFVSGVNTLDFVLFEASGSAGAGGFTGLRAELTGGVATASRVAIPGLLNTGVATMDGAALADNSSATGWTGVDPALAPFSPIVATSAQGFPIGPWLGDNGSSAWISPSLDTNGAEGLYSYSTTFDLTGYDFTSAEIYGRWATDNDGLNIILNGVPTGQTNSNQFGSWTGFNLTSGFLPGVNTLTFAMANGPGAGPTALRVEFDAASVLIPEPGSAVLLLALPALFLRRRRA